MFLFPPTSQIVQIQNELYTNMLYQRKRNRSLFGTYKPDRGGKIPTGKEEDDVFQYDTLRLARGESHQPHALRKPGELRLLVLRVTGTPPHAARADS